MNKFRVPVGGDFKLVCLPPPVCDGLGGSGHEIR